MRKKGSKNKPHDDNNDDEIGSGSSDNLTENVNSDNSITSDNLVSSDNLQSSDKLLDSDNLSESDNSNNNNNTIIDPAQVVIDINKERPIVVSDEELEDDIVDEGGYDIIEDQEGEEETDEDDLDIQDEHEDNVSDNLQVITPSPSNTPTTTGVPSPVITTSPLQEINHERRIQRKQSIINFLMEYAKGPTRTYETVAHKLNISESSGKNYLKDYIDIVKLALEHNDYPNFVLRHYNDVAIDKDKRLKFYHLDRLREVVQKYSQYDITKRLNNNDNDTFISKQSVDPTNEPSLFDSLNAIGPTNNDDRDPAIYKSNSYNDIAELVDGITPMQLLRYGLLHIYDQSTRNKASAIVGNNPTEYFMSETKMKELLLMLKSTDAQATRFIDWLKVSAKYVSRPIGFLNNYLPNQGQQNQQSAYGGYGTMPTSGMPYSPQPIGQNGSTMSGPTFIDPMDEFYYASNVYVRTLPPNHPVNEKRKLDYLEDQREEKESKRMEKQFKTAIQFKMMDFLDQPKNGANNGFGGLSTEMLMILGFLEPRVVMGEDGKPVTTYVPKAGGMMGAAGSNGGPGQMDQMTSMMGAMKAMMEMVTSMKQSTDDPGKQNMMDTLLTTAISKMFESPQSRMDEMLGLITAMDKLKSSSMPSVPMGVGGGMMNPYAGMPADAVVQIKQMEYDKDFVIRKMEMENQARVDNMRRAQEQDRLAEAANEKILGAIGQIAPMAMSFITQFMQGNKASQDARAAAAAQGGPDPRELAIKMHYEQQRRAEAEEVMRREREWREQHPIVDNPNPTAAAAMNPTPHYIPPNPVVSQQPPPESVPYNSNNNNPYAANPNNESTRFIVKERETTINEKKSILPAEYDESDFMKFSVNEIESSVQEALANQKELESYIAAARTAVQTKILNGESVNMGQPQPQHSSPPPQHTSQSIVPANSITKQQLAEEPPVDYGAILDASRSMYEPDYDGIGEGEGDTQQQQPQNTGTLEVDDDDDDDVNKEEETENVEID